MVNEMNRERILSLAVNITTNDLVENQQLIDSWIEVFGHVIGKVDFEFVEDVALKPLMDLMDRKNPLPKRKKGHRLLM